MFEKAELHGTQMGPNGPPSAKGTAKIAPEIAILETGLLVMSQKNGHLGHFGQPFWPAISEPGRPRRKKIPLGVLLR